MGPAGARCIRTGRWGRIAGIAHHPMPMAGWPAAISPATGSSCSDIRAGRLRDPQPGGNDQPRGLLQAQRQPPNATSGWPGAITTRAVRRRGDGAFGAGAAIAQAPIRMVGCFDTVMALGIRLPLLWMLTEPRFRFHNAHLGEGIEHAFQAAGPGRNPRRLCAAAVGRCPCGRADRTDVVPRRPSRYRRSAVGFRIRAAAGEHSPDLDAGTGRSGAACRCRPDGGGCFREMPRRRQSGRGAIGARRSWRARPALPAAT